MWNRLKRNLKNVFYKQFYSRESIISRVIVTRKKLKKLKKFINIY